MIWRFIPGFGDNYMMTKDGQVKHLISGKVLDLLIITEGGKKGYLMKDGVVWKLVRLGDLFKSTYPELKKVGY